MELDTSTLLRRLKRSAVFLHPSQLDVRRVQALIDLDLPTPQPVFLEGEEASGISGFLLTESPKLRLLEEALAEALDTALLRQVRIRGGDAGRGDRDEAWNRYEELLERAAENVTASDYGRHYPTTFWLYHSVQVSAHLKDYPRRVQAEWPALGEASATEIKYDVFEEYVRRAERVLRTLERRLTLGEGASAELYPAVFSCLRDNVLILTEDGVNRDLEELNPFFRGFLREDGRDFRLRLRRLRLWNRAQVELDPGLRNLARYLLNLLEVQDPDLLLSSPGYVSYLAASVSSYDPTTLWSERQVAIWEDVLSRLKTFELLHNLRGLVMRVRWKSDRLVCPGEEALRLGAGPYDLHLSPTLRPMDFMSPWVVDPGVARGGVAYDIVHFTGKVTELQHSDAGSQESAFRAFFRFQKRLDRIADEHRLYREKYLGDGAFYTGREARRLLLTAIRMQRAYREILSQGFPFDGGMRIALNHGEYRLLPFGGRRGQGMRYEIFGESVVELFRLVSGKSSHDLDELTASLVSRGYEPSKVEEFFAPLADAEEAADSGSGPAFRVHLSPSGQLINNGIVATETLIQNLDAVIPPRPLRSFEGSDTLLVVATIEDAGEKADIGLRRLGMPDLKGLEGRVLYEVVDTDLLDDGELRLLEVESLAEAFEALAQVPSSAT